jgi:hypothetical protein
MYMYKNIHSYNMFCFQYLDLFLFTIFSYLLSSFCVPYVVSFSRFSIFALHFGILLRLFESVAAAFLFYWINVCFGDFM